MKQNISLSDFYTKIEPSNSRLKSRVCNGVIIKGNTVTREVKGVFTKRENAMSALRDDANLFLQYDPDLEHYGYTELHDCHGFPYMEDSNPFPEHTASYFLAQKKKDDQGEYMVNWWIEPHDLI